MTNIRLSPKHGVNPSLLICFFCGEATAVALCGRLREDAEAPRRMVDGYEPCNTCKEKFAQGILFMEVSEYPLEDNQPSLNGYYPTGSYSVITEHGARDILKEPMLSEVLAARECLVDRETYKLIFRGGSK